MALQITPDERLLMAKPAAPLVVYKPVLSLPAVW